MKNHELQDDDICRVIRDRLEAGLPCSPMHLRAALGSGGTDRLNRLAKEVREGRHASPEPSASAPDVSAASAFPHQQLLDGIGRAMAKSLNDVLVHEREAANALLSREREQSEATLLEADQTITRLARTGEEMAIRLGKLAADVATLTDGLAEARGERDAHAEDLARTRLHLAALETSLAAAQASADELRKEHTVKDQQLDYANEERRKVMLELERSTSAHAALWEAHRSLLDTLPHPRQRTKTGAKKASRPRSARGKRS